ncbi:MAG: TIR domain-containing protein [Thaumarchaeota archaeon]|nr:TIR domain-containing protein [Nitrososphaerota archaeon]
MFRQLRSDIMVGTLEDEYHINLNTRRDTLLGNLLNERGFDSWSQLLTAYRGNAKSHARKRRIFLSFHAEDKQQVQGFRLMTYNEGVTLDFSDLSLDEPINSERSAYIKSQLRPKISASAIVLCLIGNGTAWREWVDWEIRTAKSLHKGLCGVKLKGSHAQTPPALREFGAGVVNWSMAEIVAVVEQAAARRS